MTELVFILLGLVVFQQVYWTLQFQKLVNKLMSRDFFDYMTSSTIDKKEKVPDKIKLPPDQEDLGSLSDYIR